MNNERLLKLLEEVKNGNTSTNAAYEQLRDLEYKDLGFAKIDNHREIRTGYPEVVFSQGKTPRQLADIVGYMMSNDSNILATRADQDHYNAVKEITPQAEYNEMARTITVIKNKELKAETSIAVITAGTSDLPVAEEAAITAEVFGNKVIRYYDMGVAGIHRFYSKINEIRSARVLIVVAGMEGALPSIVGGAVDKPVIGVPTSVGYGANLGGLSALLGMLTSCASGVSVVHIDNGFGAGYQASIINQL
ncbi:MAG: nickel pincer cofactor biosynthesis protein LarB [Bacteroidales bacterium]|nr:nickel pincer cofactor biosynthesis protein LarB [Bacteroidales bacterium]